MAQSTISIITASYNAADKLPNLIASLRAQTDKEFEWIVVDGASIDSTLALLTEASDLNLKFISEPDFGIYDALNKAIRLATGAHYITVGSDDTLYPDAVANYRDALKNSNADVVVAGVRMGGTTKHGFKPHNHWLGAAHMVTSHSVGMCIRCDIHKNYGYYSQNFRQLADSLFIKLICQSKKLKIYPSAFVAGEFSLDGVSNRNVARGLCEEFLIQLETEKKPALQFFLFLARLVKNASRIVKRYGKAL